MKILGFRSKTTWKMILAGFTYALIIMITTIAIINPSKDSLKQEQMSKEWQDSFVNISISQAETYVELTERDGQLATNRLNEYSEVIKQQARKIVDKNIKNKLMELSDLVKNNELKMVKDYVLKIK